MLGLRWFALGTAVVALASVVVLHGYRNDDPVERLLTVPIVSAVARVSPTPSAVASDPALVAYRGMWAAFVEAGKTSDPDAPELRRYTRGVALKIIVGALFANRELKKVILGDLVIDPKVTTVSPAANPSTVNIVDCVDSEAWLVYKASGGLFNDVPGGKHKTTAIVKRVGGVWKVDSFALQRAGGC